MADKIYKEIANTAALLWEKGWAERNGGNISRDITGLISNELQQIPTESITLHIPLPDLNNRVFLVTGTGTRMRDVAIDPYDNLCVVAVVNDGTAYKILSDNGRKPTSEIPSHLQIHDFMRKNCPQNKTVVHTHPTSIVAMTHLPQFADEELFCNTLWKMIPETYVFLPEGIALLPYLMPGGNEVAKASVEAFSTGKSLIVWAKHGAFAIAPDAMDAFDKIDLAEKSADIYLRAKATGTEPIGLTDADLQELKDTYL